jgi:hypothetical protein
LPASAAPELDEVDPDDPDEDPDVDPDDPVFPLVDPSTPASSPPPPSSSSPPHAVVTNDNVMQSTSRRAAQGRRIADMMPQANRQDPPAATLDRSKTSQKASLAAAGTGD